MKNKKKVKNIYKRKGKDVKGYALNVEFKRIIYKLYIDIALEMSTFSFAILDQQLNQNIAYGLIFCIRKENICV
jgi:predicted transcriptional regulator